MQAYEYLALPAPRRGQKVKGFKTPAERYAHELTTLMNELADEGWEYWRAECLPSEERKGLMSTAVVEHHLLIFRRPKAEVLAETLIGQAPAVQPSETRRAPHSTPELVRPGSDLKIHEARREPMFKPRATGQDGVE